MGYLLNDPRAYADEFAVGLAEAYPGRLRAARGGVVSTRTRSGTVAVVTGGGTGHYPAFGGLVGEGLATAAALGGVFASPSSQRIVSLVSELDTTAGVLFAFGNYAGDVLNFRKAADSLRRAGVAVEIVPVTDDIASADADDVDRRRGIAGGLVVYKVAGAAAAAGLPLSEVTRLARHANDCTRTLGVAFAGATLPGEAGPLFTVPDGRMAVGMGIHGEPGITEDELPTSRGLAALLVDRLLLERRGDRLVVLLSGLGSVPYEDLFVLYAGVAERLRAAGVDVVDAEVGELVTSFDMAGVSLTFFWPDAELERHWFAAADAPAFRRAGPAGESAGRGARVASAPAPAAAAGSEGEGVERTHKGSAASHAAAERALRALEAIHETIMANVDALGRLDAVAGDGDHGIGMERGASAAVAAAERAVEHGAGVASTLRQAAAAWSERAGGTSGVLWGLALEAVADACSDASEPDAGTVADGVTAAVSGISDFGRARVGDKTMLDAMVPFAAVLARHVASGASLRDSWLIAASAANAAAEATADLTPRVGRARPLAAKSAGHPDPGAVSFALAVDAAARGIWTARTTEGEEGRWSR